MKVSSFMLPQSQKLFTSILPIRNFCEIFQFDNVVEILQSFSVYSDRVIFSLITRFIEFSRIVFLYRITRKRCILREQILGSKKICKVDKKLCSKNNFFWWSRWRYINENNFFSCFFSSLYIFKRAKLEKNVEIQNFSS